MRSPFILFVVIALFTLCAATSAQADLDSAKTWFETTGTGKRIEIQRNLYWTGDYKGSADGIFNQDTYAAILAFQERRNLPQTGELSTAELASLEAEAHRIEELVRYHASRIKRPAFGPTIKSKKKRAVAPASYGPRVTRQANWWRIEPRILILP
jgi:peptidoglycan hydrolase-like protein with peptidoglycan-binding domain